MRKIILILLLSFSAQNPLLAERTKVAQVGMQFLKIGVGARAVAMGEACTVSLNDLSSVFWNPGALALVKGSGVALIGFAASSITRLPVSMISKNTVRSV